ncbi:Probable WRKY transcription factor 70 [Linum perenne]
MGTSYFHQKKQYEMVIKELAQGHEFATQLQLLFMNSSSNQSRESLANELIHKILESFSNGISALSSHSTTATVSDQAVEQQSSVSELCEDSGESCRKRVSPAAAVAGKSGASGRDNRGSYKRRKSGHSETVIKSSIQDNNSWRKYGQKEILNAKFPRSYYRCTHKFEQGCKATKQVQRLEQETNEMYSITYMGQHTCRQSATRAARPMLVNANTVMAMEPPSMVVNVKQEICVVNVDEINNVNNEENNPSEVTTDHHHHNHEVNDSVNMWQGLESFEEAISNYGNNYDHYSNYGFCGGESGVSNDSQVLDLDFGVKDIDFSELIRFDYQESNCGIFF